ncbi:hypothetical protein [Nocardia sienata]|uniref:hypothetical protein n=1 Tax=Nocardia sienata TaxID=248552 RepID=UPI0007A51793|nr:hypothetical protein [Nocardia sienata]
MKEHPNEASSALPIRGPISNQAIAIARSLWHADHCTDRALLERVAAGLRAPERSGEFHPQRDIDRIIARYRATHGRAR